jgi:hypothetical protein
MIGPFPARAGRRGAARKPVGNPDVRRPERAAPEAE